MKEILELAITIAREAGSLQRDRFADPRQIETKSSAIDLVTDVDRACDQLVLEYITSARPDDAILIEETGAHEGHSGLRWIV
ncbi:MAG: inositol monophosphatase, partial [Deltaproteobacteria bacterium]|nr:inositol monophosphatase [Deltaproteobacteria bacterium]